MAIKSEKYKDFLFLNISENDLYKKATVISYDESDKIDPPYSVLVNERFEIVINEKTYTIPKIIMHVILFEKSNNNIVADDNVLEKIEKYEMLISILEKNMLLLRSDVQNFNFYMIRQSTVLIDIIEKIIFYLSISLKELKKTTNISLSNIEQLLQNIKNSLYSKASFYDMLTSRTLNIVSLCALPILVIMTTWNASISMKKSDVLVNEYYITYRISYLLACILIFLILYNYYEDFL